MINNHITESINDYVNYWYNDLKIALHAYGINNIYLSWYCEWFFIIISYNYSSDND